MRRSATPRRSSWLRDAGLPVNPEIEGVRSLEEVFALLRAMAARPPRRRLRDRRRGGEGRPDRPAGGVGRHQPRAPLGHRVQVPAGGAHDAAARDRRAHRADRRSSRRSRSSSRCSSAASTIRTATLHNEDEVAARTCARATRSSCAGPATSSPRSSGRCWRSARRARSPGSSPPTCTSCGTPLVRKEGEAYWRCPNKRGCPSQTCEWLPLRVARRDGHRAPRLQDRDRCCIDIGWVKDPADIYSLTAEQLAQLPGFKDKSIRNLLTAIEGSKDRPLWRLLVGLNIRARRVARGAGRSRALPLGSTRSRQASARTSTGSRASAPRSPRASTTGSTDKENLTLLEKLRKAGVRMRTKRSRRRPRAADRQTIVHHRGLESMSPRGGRAGRGARPAPARRRACRRRRLRGGGGEPRLEVRRRPQQLGVETIDEQEFLKRLKR